uniref:PID domain-containing protein n=1 Tax=Sparus aurata TaxID=8175 RepID=A0A671VK90_SPAAU
MTAEYSSAGTLTPDVLLSSCFPGVVSELLSRFQGEGVRYKAKLIGMDVVPDAQGDKMCWDSMMKLKGIEVAGRRQGKHKQRVWLKVLPSGLKILDERTGVSFPDSQIALSSVCCSPVAVAPSSGSLLVLK